MSAVHVPLDAPLPDDVGTGRLSGILRYRRWPVFSARWLLGRALVFGAVLLVLAAMSALGTAVAGPGLEAGLVAGGWLLGSMMLMAFAGPVLAGFVRYARWPLKRERVGVVLAVALGMGIAFAVDRVGSARIDAQIRPAMAANAPALAAHAREAEARANAPWMQVAGVGIALAVYFALGGGLALAGYAREARQWEHARQQAAMAAMAQARREAELRLAALQAQVQPHFLFNTLASIRALVEQDPARAGRSLEALAAHLRATLPRPGEDDARPASTVARQLDVAASYLEVMRLRLGERLHVVVDADPEARALPFPPLLLITLVENAITHGIEPLRGPGEVRVEARVCRDGDGERLAVSVVDSGVGLRPGVGGGIGLANVRGQLAARFGERARLQVANRPEGGCVARIDIAMEALRDG